VLAGFDSVVLGRLIKCQWVLLVITVCVLVVLVLGLVVAVSSRPVARVLPLRHTFPVRFDTPTIFAAWVKLYPACSNVT
jgi:hypothetical protein